MIDEVRDHWYWRPGWRPGRSFYTWHLTFADSPAVTGLVTAYADVLAALPGIDPVPPQWLHLTMQGVGFADRVPLADLDEIVLAAESRLARSAPFKVTIGPAVVDPETVQLPVTPVAPLQDLRDRLRAAIGDVWGPDAIPELPQLNPHVSLGYWNTPAPIAPLIHQLAKAPAATATTTITAVSLINLNRDRQMYEWTPIKNLTLT
jgi:2'-5' RNA ligase